MLGKFPCENYTRAYRLSMNWMACLYSEYLLNLCCMKLNVRQFTWTLHKYCGHCPAQNLAQLEEQDHRVQFQLDTLILKPFAVKFYKYVMKSISNGSIRLDCFKTNVKSVKMVNTYSERTMGYTLFVTVTPHDVGCVWKLSTLLV
jgi:hypothetical protein